jgi:hypothetical protein
VQKRDFRCKEDNYLNNDVKLCGYTTSKERTAVLRDWKEHYTEMEKSLDLLEESYDALTTYPRKPGISENPYRDSYFKKIRSIIKEKKDARFRRIITAINENVYGWIEELIRFYYNCPNFNLAYFDQIHNQFPFPAIIIFDKKEIYLTTVFSPQAESIYTRTTDKKIVKSFSPNNFPHLLHVFFTYLCECI